MESYIAQLVEDLEKLAQKPLECPDYRLLFPDHPAWAFGLDYIVAWECAPDLSFEQAFGIPAEAFPPAEQLTEAQATQVNRAVLELWEVNRVLADLPEKLPAQTVVYGALRQVWQTHTFHLLPDGYTHLEFCHYVVGSCPWGMDFCTCKNEDWYKDDEAATE